MVSKQLITEAAKRFNLPVAYIKVLLKKKIIFLPPSDADEIILNALSKVYRDEQLLKISLSRLSKKRREDLIAHPELDKIDKYIFNRLCNAYKEDKTIKTGQILAEINSFYKVDINNKRTAYYYKNRIKRLRRKCKAEIGKIVPVIDLDEDGNNNVFYD